MSAYSVALAEELRDTIRDSIDMYLSDRTLSEVVKVGLVDLIVEDLDPKLDALTSCHFCGARNDLTKCAAGCDE